jgi:XRE family transcriptional regulator, regulator of sulfur utilization
VSELSERFAANLSHYREQSGLSQEALAARAEIHRTQVGELLRGRQLPRLDTLVKLAGALDIDPCALLEGMSFKPAGTKGEFRLTAPKRKK